MNHMFEIIDLESVNLGMDHEPIDIVLKILDLNHILPNAGRGNINVGHGIRKTMLRIFVENHTLFILPASNLAGYRVLQSFKKGLVYIPDLDDLGFFDRAYILSDLIHLHE